jgi:hypothetical protein
MRIETLHHIKNSAGEKELEILVFDIGSRISPRAIGALRNFGNVVVAARKLHGAFSYCF